MRKNKRKPARVKGTGPNACESLEILTPERLERRESLEIKGFKNLTTRESPKIKARIVKKWKMLREKPAIAVLLHKPAVLLHKHRCTITQTRCTITHRSAHAV